MIWYPSSSISYDCRGHFLPYPKYVTHVLCHPCSLAVLQSCMSSCDRGTKVSWSNTIPRLSNLVSEVSSRYYFAARENVMVSLWFPCDIGFADFGFSKRSLKRIIMCCAIFQAFLFNQIKYRQRSQIYMHEGSLGHTKKLRCAALWWMRSWIISLSVFKVTNLHRYSNKHTSAPFCFC